MNDNVLMRVCVVGGNAVSAFLSWRLQATNACDVTLVWKSGFDSVSQYGISFKYVQRGVATVVERDAQLICPSAGPQVLATSASSLDMVR